MGSLSSTTLMCSLEQEAPEVTVSVALECCKAEAAQEGRGQRAVLLLGQAAAMEGSHRAGTAAAERRSGELQKTLLAVQQEL